MLFLFTFEYIRIKELKTKGCDYMSNVIVKDIYKYNEAIKEKAIKNTLKYILKNNKENKSIANKATVNY
ncbi:MAG: hypothetical protein CVV02_01470 [Firmicutes bacterium HGW-Firmicutes-7]|nr:MAG: hypothetical protein CVV02_01470 [Firmicutes bacterium HGW-Firmicutes-7]